MSPKENSENNPETNRSDRSPVEDRLAQALDAQAERFEPSPGSYQRLEAALEREPRASKRPQIGRPLAIAAASIAVVGIGAFAVSQQPRIEVVADSGAGQAISPSDGGDSSDLGDGSVSEADETGKDSVGNSASDALQPENEPDVSIDDGDDSPAIEEAVEDDAAEQALSEDRLRDEIGAQSFVPVEASRSEAIWAYLNLIDGNRAEFDTSIDDLPTGPDQDPVVVPIVSGEIGIAELIVSELEDGFAVTGQTPNSDLAIDDIDTSKAADGIVTVSGTGSGFEGSASLEFFSVGDGRLLASIPVSVGSFDDPVPFTADVSVAGFEQAIVVLRSLTPVEFDPEFVTATVTYAGPSDDSEYVVVKIAADDSDGGLVMRQGPGTQFDRVTVIEPDSAPVVRLDDFAPYLIGSEVWWNVVDGNGEQGWVNSAFLANGVTPTAQQRSKADDVLIQIRDGNYGTIPFARRVAVGTMSDPQQISGQELAVSQGWIEARRLPDGEGAEMFEGSLEDFFNVDESTLFEIDSNIEASPELEDYFGGLTSQVAEVRRLDRSVHRIHVFYEPTPAGIQVIGLISEPIT